MKILFPFFIAVCLLVKTADAQQFGQSIPCQDSVIVSFLQNLQIECNPFLNKMVEWHTKKNREKEGLDGYRVEIFFSSMKDAKKEALKVKADFLSRYPDYVVHIKYVSPNFRVRVGDFRTKAEAWSLYKKIQKAYPTAFVVPDIINFPLLKPSKYE